ncbi:HTH DNA binding domain protein [Arthrobacter phage Wheelbite]|uniref:HTH DNA binding domain protein n=1 Tax=Arthrobacter phage Wheelbite TaxID=2015873 RepID=A0A222ZIJ8_9CAUD|nr:terminase small subunit [Arthrobacter phage Wheelbite]ASR84102.1 HTH DNA binding domain protein [Arthrobacter phage Wheelbite]
MPRTSETPGHSVVGRASKLTLPKLKQLIQILSGGNYVATACQFTNIGRSTFDGWRDRGILEMERVKELPKADFAALLEKFDDSEKGGVEYMWSHCPAHFEAREWPYVVMAIHTDRARAVAEMRALGIVTSAFGDHWQAAAWFLERTRPDQYGNRGRLAVEGVEGGAPIQTKTVVSLDELERKLDSIL